MMQLRDNFIRAFGFCMNDFILLLKHEHIYLLRIGNCRIKLHACLLTFLCNLKLMRIAYGEHIYSKTTCMQSERETGLQLG